MCQQKKSFSKRAMGVATLILNRPDQGNAVDLEMMRAIEESLDELNENRRSRVLVIRGKGKDFCARLDLGRQNGRVKELHEHYEQVARVNHLLRSFPGVSLTWSKAKRPASALASRPKAI